MNVGGGVHVKLRLRRPNRDWDFFPYDKILDTMLHELCHNVHGPHNASFYKLWDELRKECEELIAKGITGSGKGFDLPGRRLGGFSHQPPPPLRQAAIAAAENRARLGSLLPSGPNRLGGDSTIMAALSPIQAAAMAAERRLQDDIWCGSHSSEFSGDEEGCPDNFEDLVNMEQNISNLGDNGASGENRLDAKSQKRNHGSDTRDDRLKSNVIDLTEDALKSNSLDHGASSPKRSCKSYNSAPNQQTSQPDRSFMDLSSGSTSRSPLMQNEVQSMEKFTMWECGTCTLLNPPLAPVCELCSAARPKNISIKYKIWSCKFCTLENSVKLDKCSACGQWRYSHGAPVSTRGPNLGT
ncbi:uncharacterized protein LOC110820626 [Carica papaya]|uniref:uncharacterized protein LOC110820626 n=1 Tax=Carica papaya TaxID=3649 RepID=UPI000B8CD579|nr:uncharacterized protein LOC110820626 [Carica papaya]XP_021905846.1 uncharacterized protein LOC110820626 [Carica papaya]